MIRAAGELTGHVIKGESGRQYRLGEMIGFGAQGAVYEVDNGVQLAKLRFPSAEPSLNEAVLDRLRTIRDMRFPANFVSVCDTTAIPFPGYIMERVKDHRPLDFFLIPDRHSSFSEWYNRGHGLFERLLVGFVIAKAFDELEKYNLSYCDISGSNILINTDKGASVRMIDVDNIYTAGRGRAAVLGTPRYMAPEVIARRNSPDILSDCYSLAVILFELLRVGHPYIGDDIMDGSPELEEEALSGKFGYVTRENSKNMLPEDIVFTEKLSALFRRCFTDGLNDRMKRPTASELERAFLEAENKLVRCRSCGSWHYPRGKKCPWCDSPSSPAALLNFYDVLYVSGEEEPCEIKQVNTYILKEGMKNLIREYYTRSWGSIAENCLSLAADAGEYFVYNEFGIDGIYIKRFGSRERLPLNNNDAIKLSGGDEIYFGNADKESELKCGGKSYTFVRMARFVNMSV